MTRTPLLIAALLTALAAPLAAQEIARPPIVPGSVAFLGITFIDTSTEGAYFGAREDEAHRIDLLEDAVRTRLTDEGFTFADLAPVAQQLEDTVNPADCYGCELRMAQELGTDYVLVGEVQKVSNLILSMNLVLRDTDTGDMVRGKSVDIRSNTDDSWLRGVRYILKTTFFNS